MTACRPRKDGWMLGAWTADRMPDLTPLRELWKQGIDYVWIYTNGSFRKRDAVQCSSIDGVRLFVGSVRHYLESAHGQIDGLRWWWKPVGPSPKPPRCNPVKRSESIVEKVAKLADQGADASGTSPATRSTSSFDSSLTSPSSQ